MDPTLRVQHSSASESLLMPEVPFAQPSLLWWTVTVHYGYHHKVTCGPSFFWVQCPAPSMEILSSPPTLVVWWLALEMVTWLTLGQFRDFYVYISVLSKPFTGTLFDVQHTSLLQNESLSLIGENNVKGHLVQLPSFTKEDKKAYVVEWFMPV